MSDWHNQNLLAETRKEIERAGKIESAVWWVGSADGAYAITWEQFVKIADFDYYSGYGSEEIASDLVVVFNDKTWLERHEYDGSEWWEYKTAPARATNAKPFRKVQVESYERGLAQINNEEN